MPANSDIVVLAISVAQARIKAGAVVEVELNDSFYALRVYDRKTDAATIRDVLVDI